MSALRSIGEGVSLEVTAAALAARPNSGKKDIIRLPDQKIEGRIQKPGVFYLLPRSSLRFDALDLKQSFVPKIFKECP